VQQTHALLQLEQQANLHSAANKVHVAEALSALLLLLLL
jgi:hypothetical protein